MHRPLWQIVLTLFLIGFVVRRGAAAFILGSSGIAPVVVGAYALQLAIGVAFAVGLWLGARWVLAALLALGTSFAATAILEGFFVGVIPPLAAVSQVMVAAVATAGFALFLRHEFAEEGTARRSDGSRPSEPRSSDA